jgi:membrane-associated phospholipid phosphatase
VRYRRDPRPAEIRVFRWLNDSPELSWLRVPQQLGTPWSLVATALVMAVRGRWLDAAVALLVLPVEKCVEVGTKECVKRPRPLFGAPTVLRDDAPVDGPSMPSGHAAIATACALVLGRGAPRGVAVSLGGLAAVTALTRVHQGAHWPSDAVAGSVMGAGSVVALRAVVQRYDARPRHRG